MIQFDEIMEEALYITLFIIYTINYEIKYEIIFQCVKIYFYVGGGGYHPVCANEKSTLWKQCRL